MSPHFLTLKGGQQVAVDERDKLRFEKYTYRQSGGEIIRTLLRADKNGRTTRTLKHDILRSADVAVQYINGDCLDNRRENLKVIRDPKTSHVARFEAKGIQPKGQEYRGANKFHSAVVGVTFRKDRQNSKPWRARVQVDGKAFYLGHYATRQEAEAVALKAYRRD